MSRFKGLQTDVAPQPTPDAIQPSPEPARPSKGRTGKKGILGHFSPELSRALARIAFEENTTMQAVMGEAFDLLLRARGQHPFGER